MAMRVHDLSVPVRPGMLISGTQPERTQMYSIAEGSDYNVTGWRLHAHTGTHVETGLHYVDGRETIGRSDSPRSRSPGSASAPPPPARVVLIEGCEPGAAAAG